jgi:hypothetical protein
MTTHSLGATAAVQCSCPFPVPCRVLSRFLRRSAWTPPSHGKVLALPGKVLSFKNVLFTKPSCS